MNSPAFTELLRGHAPAESIDRLAAYAQLLERWSSRHNLVKAASREALVRRHLLESLLPLDGLPPTGRLIDIGSGAGLPGIPILCALSGWSGALVEPRQKRATFLRLAVREIGLDARVIQDRYEGVRDTGFDLITTRAVGGHDALLSWSRSRLRPGGMVAIWSTEAEARRWRRVSSWSVISSPIPGLDRGRLIMLRVCST